jgi:NADP-dependent 3-hydroxy acid dehydrogenase YdfG
MMKSIQMFDVEGKTALITGASGAFGMVAARVLAEAGCKLVLAAGNKDALKVISAQCSALGAEVITVNQRPIDEATCQKMVDAAVSATGALDILVVS